MQESEYKIILSEEVVKFTLHDVPDRPGVAADIFNALSLAGINIELVVQTACAGSTTDIAFAVMDSYEAETSRELQKIAANIQVGSVSRDDRIALITLEKEDLSKTPGAAARMFRALANNNINIDLISTSLHSITCLIKKEMGTHAQRLLLEEFS